MIPAETSAPREATPAPEVVQRIKFLGLAFAGADLALEVDRHGTITLALGAVEQVTGRTQDGLLGQNWTALVDSQDAGLFGPHRGWAATGRTPWPVAHRVATSRARHEAAWGDA